MGTALKVGDQAPNVTLPDQNGSLVSLQALWQTGALVVFFYPKDNTPGCTKQACAFRDGFEDFTAAGAHVVGISADGQSSHQDFATRHTLPFRLLSDTQGIARAAFGVKKTLGLLPGRTTFVINSSGHIRHIFSSQLNMGAHVQEALAIVRSLAPAS